MLNNKTFMPQSLHCACIMNGVGLYELCAIVIPDLFFYINFVECHSINILHC